MRDEEWSEEMARRMARHVTTYNRRGGGVVRSPRWDGDGRRRRLAVALMAAAVMGAAVMWLMGGW